VSAHVREEIGAYILGALEPEERDAVAAHLAACPSCAAEHARLAGLPALLRPAEGLEIPAAPPAVEERVLDRIAHERGTSARGGRLRRGWAGLVRPLSLTRGRAAVAAAVAGAALGAGVTAVALEAGDGPAPAEYQLRLTGTEGATARAQLTPGGNGTEVHLWVRGLPPGSEAVYEVKCERSGWSASAGTFRADSRGRAYAVLTTAARIGEYERIRVVQRGSPSDRDVLSAEIQ
jgi:anti-sigma factor RsiW